MANKDTNSEKPVRDVLRAQDIIPSHHLDPGADKPDNTIPKFNLAEEIMAQQRKIISAKRKGPENKTPTPQEKTKTDAAAGAIHGDAALPQMTQVDPIIAEIVARDIKKMCQGYYR